MSGSPRRVLHVVESFGGGVATAVEQYAAATPEFSHFLLRRVRSGSYLDSGEAEIFLEVRELSGSIVKARRAIRQAVRDLDPDLVHAHSSYAGMFVRTTLASTRQRPIVYTPHGFAFERADVSALARLTFRVVESVLANNTGTVAACSPREARLAASSDRRNIVYVPNVVDLSSADVGLGPADRSSSFLVTGFGRLTPARQPEFFCEVARIVRARRPEIEFLWVGGGDDRYLDDFRRNGIDVTGWLPRGDALAAFNRSSLHLHSAAWDGFPMVLLEANALRIPSLVRDIAAFESVPSSVKAKDPAEMAALVMASHASEDTAHSILTSWDKTLSENTRAVQRARLVRAYTDMK